MIKKKSGTTTYNATKFYHTFLQIQIQILGFTSLNVSRSSRSITCTNANMLKLSAVHFLGITWKKLVVFFFVTESLVLFLQVVKALH